MLDLVDLIPLLLFFSLSLLMFSVAGLTAAKLGLSKAELLSSHVDGSVAVRAALAEAEASKQATNNPTLTKLLFFSSVCFAGDQRREAVLGAARRRGRGSRRPRQPRRRFAGKKKEESSF